MMSKPGLHIILTIVEVEHCCDNHNYRPQIFLMINNYDQYFCAGFTNEVGPKQNHSEADNISRDILEFAN